MSIIQENIEYPINKKLIKRIETDYFVLLNEEYEFKHWIWFPDMTEEQLIDYWKNIYSMSYFCSNISKLKGELYRVSCEDFDKLETTNKYPYAHINDEDDSFLKLQNTHIIHHKNYNT